MVAMLHGEMPPACALDFIWLAPFRKLSLVKLGPGGRTVRLKVALWFPAEAVTTTAPTFGPAVACTCACPCELVTAEAALRVALPEVTVKPMGMPAAGAPLAIACTTRGAPKAAFCPASWLLPEITLKPEIVTAEAVTVKLTLMVGLSLRDTITWNGPEGEAILT